MRKLALPALAACALLAASAPVATASSASASTTSEATVKKLKRVAGAVKALKQAVNIMEDVNAGQTGSISGVDGRVTTVAGNLGALDAKVTSVIAAATDALSKLESGLLQLKAGLETLAAAVQGPKVAGQLGAAGTAAPGSGNSATPSNLPTGTVYRQIVLISGVGASPPDGAPAGARMWVKMPAVTGLYSNNTWVCMSSKGTGVIAGGSFDAQTNCPAGVST